MYNNPPKRIPFMPRICHIFFALLLFLSRQAAVAQVSFYSNCSPYPNYTVTVMAKPVNMQMTYNGGGCNINIIVAYTVTVNGSIPNGWCGGGGGGSLNNLHINFTCNTGNFEAHLPHTAGTGTVCACNNQGVTGNAACAALTLNSYCANTIINVQASGPGINSNANIVNPLPIELLYFNSAASGDAIALSWATATETNNDHFSIEKSKDGLSWTKIAQVEGAGNSLVKKTYAYQDPQPFEGLNYYRLGQTDKDGTSKYSSITDVNFKGRGFSSRVYPNPTATGEVFVSVLKNDPSEMTIDVLNTLGETVLSKTIAANQVGQLTDQAITLPATGQLFYIVISQKNSIIDRHKICVTRN